MLEFGVRSVRFRLTLWYAGFLALVLIAFSLGVYGLVAQNAYEELDRELASSIDVLQRSLLHEVDEHGGDPAGERAFTAVVDQIYRDAFPGIGVAVYSGGHQIAVKPGPYGMVPSAPPYVDSKISYRDVVPIDENSWREAASQLTVDPLGDYSFVAWTSLQLVEAELASLRNIFLYTIPLALLVVAAGGFQLVKHSLRPVVLMSETASQISSKDLSQRIPVQNQRDELGRLASTFNQLLERLEQSFTRQREFMADSSHELRTPIYVAHTAAQVILDREQRPEQEYREGLTAIDEQMVRLNRIVEDMLVLARADAGVYPICIEDFYLDETVAECLRAAKVLGTKAGVTVSASPGDELPCRGDEGLIRQLIMILLDNAIKYTPSGGQVSLKVHPITVNQHPGFQINVTDTGPGIPAEAQKHVFERFYRADKSRSRQSGGSGLGLAIAQWIAGVHGGRVVVAETGPHGTVFQATFLCDAPQPTDAPMS